MNKNNKTVIAQDKSYSLAGVYALVIAGITAITSTSATAQTVSLASPDKQIMIELSDDNQGPEYRVKFHGHVINDSKLKPSMTA